MNTSEVIGLLKEGKVEAALSAVDEVEDKKDMVVKLTEFAGALNYLKGQPLICEVLLNKSLSLWPDYAPTHYNLGVLYSSPQMLEVNEEGYLKLAEEAYREALRIEPDYHEARYNLALLLYFMGKIDEASVEYDKILAKLGDDPSFRELGVLLMQAKKMGR